MPRIINNFHRKSVRKELRLNQTPQEILLWSEIRNNKTGYKWKRQVSIGPYVADFYCWKKLLVIEIDGAKHSENKDYDTEREKYFEALGIKTLRFWNSAVEKQMEKVMETIARGLERKVKPSPLLSGEGLGEVES